MDTSKYQSSEPYPQVKVDGPNPEYAALILSDIASDVSEMSAVNQYLYDYHIAEEKSELKDSFLAIAVVEMRHLDMLSKMARLLGADPRMWSRVNGRMRYWTPAFLKYSFNEKMILENLLLQEIDAIKKYRVHVRMIADKNINEVLERIILDEEVHMKIFTDLLDKAYR